MQKHLEALQTPFSFLSIPSVFQAVFQDQKAGGRQSFEIV